MEDNRIDRIRADVTACLSAMHVLEERLSSLSAFVKDLHDIKMTITRQQELLHYLVDGFKQLDHIVQKPNGREPLVLVVDKHEAAIQDLRSWRDELQSRFWKVVLGVTIAFILSSVSILIKLGAVENLVKGAGPTP